MANVQVAVATQHPLELAYQSARRFGLWLFDQMYGTPERSRLTMYFGFALFTAVQFMAMGSNQAVCR